MTRIRSSTGLAVILTALSLPATASEIGRLEFLGEAHIPLSIEGHDAPVGGLSSISYDAELDRFYAISDDRAEKGPVRFYTLTIGLADGKLSADDVEINDVTLLREADGAGFAQSAVDPEGLTLAPDRTIYVTSEGVTPRGIPPFVRQYDLAGQLIRTLEVPRAYAPQDGERGVRDNLGFESLTITPDGRYLFTATEGALVQDGPEVTLERGTRARILRFDLQEGSLSEYVLPIEAVPLAPIPADGFRLNGLVELLALGPQSLLAMERAFAIGAGNSVRIFRLDLAQADDISEGNVPDPRKATPVTKEFLFDVGEAGKVLDNVEGLTIGPTLPDGRQTLILVADDNFSRFQSNQVLAFALDPKPPTVAEVQGSGHRSPFEGQWVFGVDGLVTAVGDSRRKGFWLQSSERSSDPGISNGVFVRTEDEPLSLEIGQRVKVAGRVVEEGRNGALTVTRIVAGRIQASTEFAQAPEATLIGPAGDRRPPTEVIDDDQMKHFEPESDGIDFWESLEGMLVRVERPRVVGAASRFGDLVVVASEGEGAGMSTTRGGLLLRPSDANPERLVVARLHEALPSDPEVGDVLDGSLVGVIDYAFGNFRLYPTQPVPGVVARDVEPSGPARGSSPGISIATLNVLNLGGDDPPEKFAAVANLIALDMGGPAVIGLQEVQDDSGAADDGVVTADATLTRLVEAVVAAGGPRYEHVQIDPENNSGGGQPGGNIRVAFLVDPSRAGVVRRGEAGSEGDTTVETGVDGPYLTKSPGRLGTTHPAYVGDRDAGFQPARRPLAIELDVDGRRLFVVDLHLKSKSGDTALFGATQPQQRITERQRNQQARLIHDFVARLLESDPQARAVVLGDLNEHEFRPPLAVLTGGLLENLVERIPLADRYTFNYQGNSQVLDHILVSSSLAARVSRIEIVHANADLSAAVQASDHDPVVAVLDLK